MKNRHLATDSVRVSETDLTMQLSSHLQFLLSLIREVSFNQISLSKVVAFLRVWRRLYTLILSDQSFECGLPLMLITTRALS